MKKNFRIGKIAKIILATIGIGGLLVVVVAAPNIVQLIPVAEKLFGKNSYKRNYNNANTISRLIQQGNIKIVTKNGRHVLILTPKGERVLGRAKMMKQKRGRWDGKWRLVSFDIWENARSKRDKFRQEIKEYGFLQLQKSLWIIPYPCEDFIMLLRTDMRFGKNIRYIEASKVENDTALRKHFGV